MTEVKSGSNKIILCVTIFRNIHRPDFFSKSENSVDTFMNIINKRIIRMGLNESRRGNVGSLGLRKKKSHRAKIVHLRYSMQLI